MSPDIGSSDLAKLVLRATLLMNKFVPLTLSEEDDAQLKTALFVLTCLMFSPTNPKSSKENSVT